MDSHERCHSGLGYTIGVSCVDQTRASLQYERKRISVRGAKRQIGRSVRLRLLTLLKSRSSLPPYRVTDMRSIGPTERCICGSTAFSAIVSIEDSEVILAFPDASCINCGNIVLL